MHVLMQLIVVSRRAEIGRGLLLKHGRDTHISCHWMGQQESKLTLKMVQWSHASATTLDGPGKESICSEQGVGYFIVPRCFIFLSARFHL